MLLAEDSSVGTEEIEGTVQGANVEDLTLRFHIRVISGPLLVNAVEGRLRDLGVNRVINSGLTGNSRIIPALILSVVAAASDAATIGASTLAAETSNTSN